MTRNQMIALGCGGAGCLGLIVVVIAAGLIYFFSANRTYSTNRNYNYNVNTNRNDNLNSNDNENSNTSTSSSTPSSASSLSDDDKHKLYQAAQMTGDDELLRRVSVKLGLMNEDYTHGDAYEQFIIDHAGWVVRNLSFISSLRTPEQARAYVDQNFPD